MIYVDHILVSFHEALCMQKEDILYTKFENKDAGRETCRWNYRGFNTFFVLRKE
jgi:hypothetical protein